MSKKKTPSIFKNRKEAALFPASFIIALIFFIWQRKFFSWDFSVYVMNAEAVFKGFYFEWLRAPLASLIMIPFTFLSRQITIYAFTIIITIFYFHSLKLFHDKFLAKYNHSEIFYLIAISPFILNFGLGVGTELLSLTLIILFLTYAFSYSSFIFLGLAMLTRYSNVVLLPLVFFQKNIKKILLGLLILLLVFFPWFIINYFGTGHALTSLGDYYALNALEQAKPQAEIGSLFSNLFDIVGFLIPFFILGVLAVIKNWKKIENKEKELIYSLLAVIILTTLIYEFNSLRNPRYLFNLSFPIIYFSFIGAKFILEKLKGNASRILKIVLILFFIALAISTFFVMESKARGLDKEMNLTKQIISKMGTMDNNCTVSSDLWVYFDWQNKPAVPAPFARDIQNQSQISLMEKEGYNIILFKNSESYQKNLPFISQLNETQPASIIEDNKDYIWLHNDSVCKQTDKINQTYIDALKSVGEFPQDFTGCDALLLRFKLTKLCRTFPFL